MISLGLVLLYGVPVHGVDKAIGVAVELEGDSAGLRLKKLLWEATSC